MRRFLKIAIPAVLAISLLAGGVVFALGAVAAEGALHPPRLPVARVCPCISHMRCESVTIEVPDGTTLRAWSYVPEIQNGGTVILLHGVGSNRQDMVPLGYVFLQNGYSILVPDLRGHGESGGLATYGIQDEDDVRAWLDWIQKQGKALRIYGFGASLGASVLLESLRHETRFHAVVAESAFSDFPSIADERIGRMLPPALRWGAVPFVESGLAWARWKDGVDLRLASSADALKVTRVPVLLIHGLADDRTSPENSRRLAAVNPAVQLWLVPGSGHADAWKTVRTDFEARVLGWFRTN